MTSTLYKLQPVSWEEYWSQRTRSNLIVFCTDDEYTNIHKMVTDRHAFDTVARDCVDKEVYREMHQTCIIVTKEELMRGIDYKRHVEEELDMDTKDGIDLVIAAPLSNSRMVQQACGRVGRYKENCGRYRIQNVQELDTTK